MAADIELLPDGDDPTAMQLQLVILESLAIRRDAQADSTQGSTVTRLLVKDKDAIAPGAVVAQTEILCKEAGTVGGLREGMSEAVRRVLVVREADVVSVEVPVTPTCTPGQLMVAGASVASGCTLEESGQVVAIERVGALNQEEGLATVPPELFRITLRVARPYRVSAGAVLHVGDGDLVQRGDNLVLLVFERTKTGDIIQGLPRIEELLEARKPKEACILARRPGTAQVSMQDDSIELKVVEDDGTISDYPMLPGQNAIVSDGQRVTAGEAITDGPANPHEILEVFFNYHVESLSVFDAACKSFQACQTFLVNEVQSVYQSQGIEISDKHIEVIVRQMTNKVRVDDGGDTTMLPGELVELRQIEQVNEAMSITGGAPAQYTPMLLGITKASLNTDSFISAASFQETTRVLTEAAIEGKSDWLRGLKENVIIGRLIPAGTGFNAYDSGEQSPWSDPGMFDDDVVEDLREVVLDDRTARLGLGFEVGGRDRFGDDLDEELDAEDDSELDADVPEDSSVEPLLDEEDDLIGDDYDEYEDEDRV